jgi:macrolide transport system ATP-binding/permease protein
MSDRLSLDLRDAFRRLAAAPGFTIAAVLILAIGIGGSTAIFSAVDAFAIRNLPYERPHELVRIYQDSDDGRPESNSYPAYIDIASHDSLFSNVGAVMPEGSGTLLTPSGDAEIVQLEFATSSYFPVLGLHPGLGRWFVVAEDKPGAPPVAVLTHHAWLRRFAGDPAIVGRAVRLSGTIVTIVGVGPEEYNGFVPGLASEFWLSISSLGPVGGSFRERTLTRREDHWFQVIARLAPGGTIQQAQSAMTTLAERLGREFPETDRGRRISVMSVDSVRVHPEIDAMIYPTAGLHLILAALVLALVCSNLANLTLARGSARRRELAVRLAIGATRAQIVRSLTIESLLLSLGGGALGVLLAGWCIEMLGRLNAPAPLSAHTTLAIDYRVMLFALLISLCTGVAFGLLPAVRSTRTDLRSSLQREVPFPLVRVVGLRGVLIGVQVAISVALLAGSGILLRSMMNAVRVDPGFDPRPIALMTIDAGQGGRPGPRAIQTLTHLQERVSAMPGVAAAALTTRPPVSAFGPSTTLVLDEQATPTASGDRTVEVRFAAVTPEYFGILGMPVLHGRCFSDADREDGQDVAIVSKAMAERFWGTSDVVGRRYRHQGDNAWITIVGVVGDVTIKSPGESPGPFLYRPFAQGGFSRATLVARATRDPAPVLLLMREEVRAMDNLLPVLLAMPMPDHIARSLALPRAAAVALTGFGLLAVILASLGVYSVVAYSVARRRNEMGVRMALGATRAQVTRMVVGEMMTLVIGGLLAGTALAALITPALRSLLIGVQPVDAATFVAVAALVGAVALITTWIPARRAASTDPAAVLRAE